MHIFVRAPATITSLRITVLGPNTVRVSILEARPVMQPEIPSPLPHAPEAKPRAAEQQRPAAAASAKASGRPMEYRWKHYSDIPGQMHLF